MNKIYSKRIHKISTIMDDTSIAIITSTLNIQYLIGFYSEPYERLHALIILPSGQQLLVIPSLVKELALEIGLDSEIITYEDHENPWELLKKILSTKEILINTIYVEGDHLTYNRFLTLRSIFESAEISTIDVQIATLRMQKSAQEIQFLQKAVELCESGIEAAKNALVEGITEIISIHAPIKSATGSWG